MKYKLKSAIASAALLVATLIPLSASASEVCVGADCTVTFEYTGAVQTWIVPNGASNVQFDVKGAQGAGGAGGGTVKGNLRNLPGTVSIYVGGAGSYGAYLAGGFNGGGSSGGNRGNEGSGGGASDIRLGTALGSRIAVAGGGGGPGGLTGAAGAPGGGLQALRGGSGQGAGGFGGGQSSGGSGGSSNGGSAASGGGFGAGGSGGSSWNAGGGGGGGGWYGGGGGGGDDDNCCADGGGGGGGSSFTDPTHVANPTHIVDGRAGNGTVTITYQLPLMLVSFSGVQIDSDSALYSLEMSSAISGLDSQDFELTSSGCVLNEINVNESLASIALTNCAEGSILLTLLANSVGSGATGPNTSTSFQVEFDGTGPDFVFDSEEILTSQDSLLISFTTSPDVLAVESEMFEIQGCEAAEILQNEVSLSGCVTGLHQLLLPANSLSDQWGNLGPQTEVSFSFEVDRDSPEALWSEVTIAGTGPFTYSATLTFSEEVDFNPQSVSINFDSDCTLVFEQQVQGWRFDAVCGYGEGNFELAADSLTDRVLSTGPSSAYRLGFDNRAPLVVAQPEPEPGIIAPPSAPAPVSELPPTASEPDVESTDPADSETVATPETTPSPVTPPAVPAKVIDQALKLVVGTTPKPIVISIDENESPLVVEMEPERVIEPAAPVVTNLEPRSEPVLAQPVRGAPLQAQAERAWFAPWIAALLAGFMVLIGLGFWRFSGR
ncbi:glycine-rich protein [Candidatus Aquiluna sp. UB-MaderosW2red]|uniref:glycine-rich protein n=1 Tax=Candidatus Aquiluna sp. UB-MaderosW2red TaxID=1855377 RepID=UPI000B8A5146|nr:glycine-rich protein [Candidatus Aquiluna sp. UB-MaderosW2red]